MATTVAARPTAPLSKPKRPAPPAVQTTPNGIGSHSSPSPSLSSKRPPSGFKHPPGAGPTINGGHATSNGTGPRLNRRKESQQKTADGNKPRLGKVGTNEGAATERRPTKKITEPYVRSTSYMLKRHRKSAVSLVLHLHPTYFRLDQQEGSFSYNSPARKLLEHVKDQTVPHDMLEELHQAGVKFYEGCLIVQIHDHRNTSKDTANTSSSSKKDKNQPYSVHNYNEHLTPSPYVPYPHTKSQDDTQSTSSSDPPKDGESIQKPTSAGKGKESESSTTRSARGPRVTTTVLFPTPLSLQEDVLKIANTVDPRSNNRKGSQIGSSSSAPPAKKQKLQHSNKSLQSIEAMMILSTAPPLYLDPVKNVEEAQALIDKLSDPLCCRDPPAPKSRKRTVAELAADEALAAEEQRFMLIMDERLVPGTTASGTGKTVGTDSEGNGANFEARFESFKTLEEIKETLREREKQAAQQNEEAKQQKAKAEQERAQEQRVQMANARRQEQQMLRNSSLHQNTGSQQQQPPQTQQQSQPQQQHQGSAQPQMPPVSTHHAHPPIHTTMPPNPHQLAATQGPQSSPVVRNMTPQNASSPAMGSAMHRGPSAIQMNMTSSTQGTAGSPPRPGSAIPHGHPGPIPMTVQRSQQPPSRNGTPSMPNGTPRLQQATPVMRNITPTPRMSQASPVNSASAATPMMGHNMLGTPHINGQQLTPQQHQAFLRAQQDHQARQQQMRAYQQQHMHGSPPNIQLSQQHLQQLAAQQQAQQRSGMQSHGQEASYRQMLQSMSQMSPQQQQQQMHAQAGNQAMINRMMMQQGQNPVGNQQQVNFGGPMGNMVLSERSRQQVQMTATKMYDHMRHSAMEQHGPDLPPDLLNSMKMTALNNARNMLFQQRKTIAQQQQQQAVMNQLQQNGAMNGMSGM